MLIQHTFTVELLWQIIEKPLWLLVVLLIMNLTPKVAASHMPRSSILRIIHGMLLQIIPSTLSKLKIVYSLHFKLKTYSRIRFYATVTTSQGALIIGGMVELVEVRTVGAYNDDGWKKLNDLQAPRLGHRAIVNGDKVFVIGGLRKQ